ncbi:MAG: sulfotransferase, partial [bacterium]|nr:sulfotransferase [bacterium]
MHETTGPPVFVIGNPRSGTTMFRLMLTCHPNIVVPPESGFLVNLYHEYREFSGKKEELHAFVEQVLKSDKMEEWKISAPGLSNYLEARNPSTYAQ